MKIRSCVLCCFSYVSVIVYLICSLLQQQAFADNKLTATGLLFKAQQAYHKLNFDLFGIKILENRIEPLRISHGIINNQEIFRWTYLNGLTKELIYRDNKVSYFNQKQRPYSINMPHLPGQLSTLLNVSINKLQQEYQLTLAGKERVAGREARLIRIVPKEPLLYSSQLWLDLETNLPLRLDTTNHQRETVEQLLIIKLVVFRQPSLWIKKLVNIKIPPVESIATSLSSLHLNKWQLAWLPKGFKPIKQTNHKLTNIALPVSCLVLSNNIINISVYASTYHKGNIKFEPLVRQGATALSAVIARNDIEITVVGDIPPSTARKIADNISLKLPN